MKRSPAQLPSEGGAVSVHQDGSGLSVAEAFLTAEDLKVVPQQTGPDGYDRS